MYVNNSTFQCLLSTVFDSEYEGMAPDEFDEEDEYKYEERKLSRLSLVQIILGTNASLLSSPEALDEFVSSIPIDQSEIIDWFVKNANGWYERWQQARTSLFWERGMPDVTITIYRHLYLNRLKDMSKVKKSKLVRLLQNLMKVKLRGSFNGYASKLVIGFLPRNVVILRDDIIKSLE